MERTRGGGARRHRRRRSIHRGMVEPGSDYFDVGHSEANSTSSNNDDMEGQTRDKMLDDALFGFFRKQALKSLKRNFTDFCKDFTPKNEVKMNTTDGLSRTAFSRYSLKYFVEVIRKLTEQQRSVIAKFGFGCLLLLDLYDIPSEFSRWVADCVDPLCSQITIDYKPIDISKQTVHLILGLPNDGLEVPCNSNAGKNFILSQFQLSEMPHITFFGNKLSGPDELSDHDIFVCFMTIAISCFLCPSLKEYPNTKYLSVLKYPEATKAHDFSKLVYEYCLDNINQFSMSGKLKGRRLKVPVCCNYVPVVCYLDCLDFGRQNVDETIPRIVVWKGSMIRFFSELDRKRRKHFGKRRLKKGLTSCYTQIMLSTDVKRQKNESPSFDLLPSDFRNNIHTQFFSNLRPDVIDGIIDIAENFLSNKSSKHKPKPEMLVINVLDFLCNSSHIPNSVANKCLGHEAINSMKNVYNTQINVPSNICDNANALGLRELRQTTAPEKHAPHEVIQQDHKDTTNTDPVTPDCMITKIVEPHSLMTAPAMNPLKKVKARRCQVISTEDEAKIFSQQPQSPTYKDVPGQTPSHFSPIAHINLPDSPHAEPSTGDYKIKRLHLVQQVGSKQAPFLVTSPKPPVIIQSHQVQQVGSKQAPILVAVTSPKPHVITRLHQNQQVGSKQAPVIVNGTSPKPPMNGISTNIQMVGSNDFRRRCSELAKKADSTYNNLLSNQHGFTSKGCLQNAQSEAQIPNTQTITVHPVRQKYSLVNSLMTAQNPPLQQNKKFPVSDDDIIHYSAIVELGHSAQHKKTLGVKYPEVHCNYQSLGESLMPGGEVDNFLIPSSVACCLRKSTLHHLGGTIFFHMLGKLY
jgi:hypothetical protein